MYTTVQNKVAIAMCYQNQSQANIGSPFFKVLHYYKRVYIMLSQEYDKYTIFQYLNTVIQGGPKKTEKSIHFSKLVIDRIIQFGTLVQVYILHLYVQLQLCGSYHHCIPVFTSFTVHNRRLSKAEHNMIMGMGNGFFLHFLSSTCLVMCM